MAGPQLHPGNLYRGVDLQLIYKQQASPQLFDWGSAGHIAFLLRDVGLSTDFSALVGCSMQIDVPLAC